MIVDVLDDERVFAVAGCVFVCLGSLIFPTLLSSLRGDEAGSAPEPDGVLPAQVLPALRDQQGEVRSGHRLPLQLP